MEDNKVAASKQVPVNLEAEIGVINSLLIDDNLATQVMDSLNPEDFFDHRNRILYTTIIDLFRSGISADINIISSKLQEKNQFNEVGGFDYIRQVLNYNYTTVNLDSYIRLVQETSLKRKTIDTLTKLSQDGYNTDLAVNDYLEDVEGQIFKLTQYRNTSEFKSIATISDEVVKNEEEMSRQDAEVTGLSVGFENLNKLTLGLQNGNLIILAARPAMGKSAYALNLAVNAARSNKNGKATVAVFSLEMPAEQLVRRMFAAETGIPLGEINKGKLTETQWRSFQGAALNLSQLNLYFDESSLVTVGDIRSKCRKLKATSGLDLVVIDYLQLITGSGGNKSKVEEVSQISRGLKLLARELDIPVIALSQLSRQVEAREDKRPIMSDLRDSGSIEQDADIVAFLYRDDYYTKKSTGQCQLIVAKNRSGSLATLNYIFDGAIQKFNEIGKEENE